ncbi:MAG: Asp-tRNA(Asn)/Glu-tRNA(Gln) amidotransferase subunit GatA, partial [Chitinophagales bacterium]|nr:Asp-tRNA(Asn)/Glu-tRNA(Gln) amidotransferase subunit GatA [Chitinophagales bacterium]
MTELSEKTIKQVQQELKTGVTTCEQLVNEFLQRIEASKHLNAFLEVYTDEAIERARFLDNKKESRGKLYGCVIAIKDNICYKQHKVSAGSKILEGFTSLFSST